MNTQQWSKRVSNRVAIQRAGGRKRYNAQRRREQLKRRVFLLRFISMCDDLPHGIQQELAARFGVSKATMSKDFAWAKTECGEMLGSGIVPRITTRYGRVVYACWEYRG